MTHILTWSACKLRCSSQLRIQFFDIYWWAGRMLAQRSRLCGRVPLPAPLNTPSIPLVKKDTPTPKSYLLRFLSQNMIFGQRNWELQVLRAEQKNGNTIFRFYINIFDIVGSNSKKNSVRILFRVLESSLQNRPQTP